MTSDSEDRGERGRFDVIQRYLAYDEDTGELQVRIEPDPLRYEWQEHDGDRLLYDRFDQTLIQHALVMEMLKQAVSMPKPPPIAVLSDIERYVGDRRCVVAAVLDGHELTAERSDASQELLASLAGDELGFVVMSVDVVDSSTLANSVSGDTLARVLSALALELSELVALFHGHVLRYAGDGLTAYFPEPSFITNNDLALDCALCIRQLIAEALNPELKRRGLPALDIRIGLDAGEAAVRVLGSPATKRHADIIGDVVSLASNIESAAAPNEVLMGAIVERNLHVTWRKQCEPAPGPGGWNLKAQDGALYRLHRLRPDATRPIEAPARLASD